MLPYYLISGTRLPEEVYGEPAVWHSTLPELIDSQGALVPLSHGMSDEIQLQAATSAGTYTFRVRLLGADYCWLAGYTRKPADNPNEYSLSAAASLHLALQIEGESFEVLNSHYGVLFAKADYSGSPAGETVLLQAPYCFRLAGQGFGIIAIPIDSQGHVRIPGVLLYFETMDFVHYEEKEAIRLSPNALVTYSCELDAETMLYRLGWTEKDGESRYVTTEDFKVLSEPQAGAMFPARTRHLNLQGTESAQILALTASEAEYLRRKLARVRNVSMDELNVTISAGNGSHHLDSIRAVLRYSDGSISRKRIAIELSEIEAIDFSVPAVYSLRGKVLRADFPYPMMRTRPDPFILAYKDRYYFISTDDDRQRKIYIRSSDTLAGLEDGQAEEVLLWDGNIPNGERAGQHWAPELHIVDEKLCCFLAISVNNEWHGVQAHVAILDGEDPMNPEHWGTPKRILDRDGNYLSDLAERERNLSLDMTYFEHDGKSYVCWSQPKWFEEQQELAALYIATVNPEQPWILTSDSVRICRNEYGWDRNDRGVAEGAFVMKREGKIYMVYSGSGVGPRYTVGLLELPAEGDPLDSAAWRKTNYPLMHSLSLPGQYGPGHNMLLQDLQGDWYNVYHACGIHGGFRDSSIRTLHFRFDGTPILDMREEEELLPELELVTVILKIE